MAPGSNIPDLSAPEMEEIRGMDLVEEDLEENELDDETLEVIASVPLTEQSEILEFPKKFDFDDEMDDLLSKPLIEVVPKKFLIKDEEIELDNEDETSDLLLEDFEEILIEEDLDAVERPLTIQPGLGKWMKKYQSSEAQKTEKTKGKKHAKKKNKKEFMDEVKEKGKPKTKASKSKKKPKKKDTVSKKEKKTEKVPKTVKNKEATVKKAKKKKKKTAEQKLSKKKAIRKFANRSIVEDGETISVTLADLYVKQGKIEKAIVAYERLSLIIPEKKAFFASLIKKLKKK